MIPPCSLVNKDSVPCPIGSWCKSATTSLSKNLFRSLPVTLEVDEYAFDLFILSLTVIEAYERHQREMPFVWYEDEKQRYRDDRIEQAYNILQMEPSCHRSLRENHTMPSSLSFISISSSSFSFHLSSYLTRNRSGIKTFGENTLDG